MDGQQGNRRFERAAWAMALLLIAFGAVLRGYDLDGNPPGLWQDEASTGVDAYLIWTTGRDRAGAFLPVISRSFGDYPLTLYRYLTAPVVGLLGLTVGHQRWAACFAGVSMLLSLFAWLRFTLGARTALCALVSAVLTPTWIHFSRYGSEAILLPATLTGGLALFAWARAADRPWLNWVAAFVLAASAYTYHAVKLFLPLWILPFAYYQWPYVRELWLAGRRRHVVGPALLFAAGVLPSVVAALTPEGMARGNTVAAWQHYHGGDLVRTIAHNYLAYFDPTMLYLNGGPAVAQSIPGVGIWSIIDLPLMVLGFAALTRRWREDRIYALILGWFLLGPLPGGITYEAHNIGRVIGWLPTSSIVSGLGMAAVLEAIRRGWAAHRPLAAAASLTLTTALVAGWAATAVITTRLTLIRYPRITERDWQFEVTRALLCAKRLRGDRRIVVSPSFSAVEIFSQFHLTELPKAADGTPLWTLASRTVIGPDELYAMPAQERRPEHAEVVCEIKQLNSGETKAWVFAAPPGQPPGLDLILPPPAPVQPAVPKVKLGPARDVPTPR